MSEIIKPYRQSGESKKQQVSRMFDGISGVYDTMNRIITFGIDKRWRRKVMKFTAEIHPRRILDIASGTGDLAILAATMTDADEIIGADISEGMLQKGREKIHRLRLESKVKMEWADAENLPYPDDAFDAVTVAFGVRNFEDLDKGLSEILRVLRPGGRFVVLETSVPSHPLVRRLYLWHSDYLLPFFGRLFSKDPKAYRYLSKSAQQFPYGEAFNNKLKKNGFIQIQNHPQTLGTATVYVAHKR